jgi:hypothetical protein
LFYNNTDIGNGSNYDLTQCWSRFTTNDGEEKTIRLFTKPSATGEVPSIPTLDNCSDTVWTDFTWAYVLFSGLSAPSIGTQTLVSTPYVTVKCVYGVEVQPFPKSSFVFFQNPAPIPDDRAIHAAAGIIHQKPDGYPSAANDFGSILGLVTKFAPTVINWLSSAFGSKSEKHVSPPATDKSKAERQCSKTKKAVVNDVLKGRISQLTKDVAKLRMTPALRQRRQLFTSMRPVGLPRRPVRLNATASSYYPRSGPSAPAMFQQPIRPNLAPMPGTSGRGNRSQRRSGNGFVPWTSYPNY